jgi:hypothetical protein
MMQARRKGLLSAQDWNWKRPIGLIVNWRNGLISILIGEELAPGLATELGGGDARRLLEQSNKLKS